MEDYAANSKREKEGLGNGEKASKAEKKVEKVVDSKVIVQKKSIGRKVRDLFIEADFRSVGHHVAFEILIPAIRNMIVDASTKGIERVIYGPDPRRRGFGPGPRISYQSPIHRSYTSYTGPTGARQIPPVQIGSRNSRQSRNDVILASRPEAEAVLEAMNDIIDTYEVVSVADLNALLGLESNHVDQKWGWVFVGNSGIRQVREGYLIDLPPEEPIQ